MSLHLNENKAEFAPIVLMPGDPDRAAWIANNFLHDVKYIKNGRKNDAYTGFTKNNVRVTVMSSGMGIPSMAIYASELFEYGVETIIRIGTCGIYQEDINIGDIIIPSSVSTNTNWSHQYGLGNYTFAPSPSEYLLRKAIAYADEKKYSYKVGNILCSDIFYDDDTNFWKKWARLNVLGVEMETYSLYAIAAKYKRNALSILFGSDHFVTNEHLTKEERVVNLTKSVELAISLAESFYLSDIK